MTAAKCRLCDEQLTDTFVDLGMSPLCESYVPAHAVDGPESFYPLHVRICSACLLVQLPSFFSSRRRHTSWPRDWSSDVCSSDLARSSRTSQSATSRTSTPRIS